MTTTDTEHLEPHIQRELERMEAEKIERARALAADKARKRKAREARKRERSIPWAERQARRERKLAERRAALAERDEEVRAFLRDGPRTERELKAWARTQGIAMSGDEFSLWRTLFERVKPDKVYSAATHGAHYAIPGHYDPVRWTTKRGQATERGEEVRRMRQEHAEESAEDFLSRMLADGPIEYGQLRRRAREAGHDYMQQPIQDAYRDLGLVAKLRRHDSTTWIATPEQAESMTVEAWGDV